MNSHVMVTCHTHGGSVGGRGVGSWIQGVGCLWRKMRRGGEGPKVCRMFHLEHFLFTSWLIGAFDLSLLFDFQVDCNHKSLSEHCCQQ